MQNESFLYTPLPRPTTVFAMCNSCSLNDEPFRYRTMNRFDDDNMQVITGDECNLKQCQRKSE